MALITASGAERAVKCPSSLVLPKVRTTNEYAERGTALHSYVAAALLRGREAALAECADEYRDECAAIDLDAVQSIVGAFDTLYVELALMSNIKTGDGKILGEDIKRAYPHTDDPYVVYGTADLVTFRSGVLTIFDIKTGQRVASAGVNAQLLSLALLARAAFSDQSLKPSAYRIGIIYLDEYGNATPDQAVVDDMDLDGWQHELRTAVLRARDAQRKDVPDVETGAHCRYCPAFTSCPAKNATALQLAERTGIFAPSVGGQLATLNVQQAGEVYAKAKEAIEWLDTIMDAIKERAQIEPIPLPGGSTLREIKGSESIDYSVAFPVLMEHYGAEAAATACSTSISKTSIKKALNGRTGEALDRIKAAGGIKNGKPKITEVK